MPAPAPRTALLHPSACTAPAPPSSLRILSLLSADLPSNLAGPNFGNGGRLLGVPRPQRPPRRTLQRPLPLLGTSFEKFPDHWLASPAAAPTRQKILALLRRDFPTSSPLRHQRPAHLSRPPRPALDQPSSPNSISAPSSSSASATRSKSPPPSNASTPSNPHYAQLLLAPLHARRRTPHPLLPAASSPTKTSLPTAAPTDLPPHRPHPHSLPAFPRRSHPRHPGHTLPQAPPFPGLPPPSTPTPPSSGGSRLPLHHPPESHPAPPSTSETELLCTHLDKLFTDAQQIYGPLIKSPKNSGQLT